MLVPFLELAGVTDQAGSHSVAQTIAAIFEHTGIQFNLITALVTYVGIVAFVALIGYTQQVQDAKLIQDYTSYLRNRLHKAFANADWSLMLKKEASELGSLLITETQRVGLVIQFTVKIAGTIALMLIYVGTSLFLSPEVSLIVLISIGVLYLLQRPLNKIAFSTGFRIQHSQRRYHNAVQEHIAGFKDVKSAANEQGYHNQFVKITSVMRDIQYRYGKARAQSGMIFEITSVIMVAVFFYISLVWFQIPVVELIVLLFIFARLTPQLKLVMSTYQSILNTLPAFTSVTQFYEECLEYQEREHSDSAGRKPDAWAPLRLQNIGFRYEADRPVLRNLSVTIPRNRFTVLYGPSGSGKSTIADLILKLQQPDTGTITANGIDLSELDTTEWREGIGYVAQHPFLFNDTIRNNLLWANPDADEEQLVVALRKAAAWNFVSELPQGIDSSLGDQGISLSGGERQRIALARALVRSPHLLILDETTNALDPATATEVLQHLAQLKDEVTLVLISHDAQVRSFADHEIIIHKERVDIEQEAAV